MQSLALPAAPKKGEKAPQILGYAMVGNDQQRGTGYEKWKRRPSNNRPFRYNEAYR
jgi:hypothetical protein